MKRRKPGSANLPKVEEVGAPVVPGAPVALIVALIGIALFVLDVLGARSGLIDRVAAAVGGTAILGLIGLAALLLALRALWRRRALHSSAIGLVLSLGMVGFPLYFLFLGLSHPAIHDISTDLANPPQFAALRAVRAAAGAAPLERSAALAARQKEAYPNLHPLILDEPAAPAFAQALQTAKAMGWQIAFADPAAGRIEATATTFLFRFKDDVVIRIEPEGPGKSRIDVRSVSRLGIGDFGTNAARIHTYLARLDHP